MKQPPKVHWHPFLMLGSGAVFLMLALGDLCFYAGPDASYLMHFANGIYSGNHVGNAFAIFLLVGLLFVGIGVYAIRYHRH